MNQPAPRRHLAEVPLFAGLPAPVLEALARAGRLRQYPNGQILCNEGDPGEALYVLESGRLRVSRLTTAGQEAVLAVVEAPAALGELALLDGGPRDATVTAQGPVTVRLVPRADFLALLRAEPAAVEGLLRTLAGWVRHANARQAALLGLDVPGRLAAWLLARADRHGTSGPAGTVVELGRSQGELAAELGTTRSTLNRALAELARLGLIETEGERVVLLDPTELRTIAG
jgi:CRP-like cAMP-binding protein